MMRIHLASIRRFYPSAPVLISKKGGDPEEMEAHRAEFGILYWMENCGYNEALLRLLKRCETEYVCLLDHDTVFLSGPKPLIDGLSEGRYDLVGIEERIREPHGRGWLRFAPGYMDATFLAFNLGSFLRRWGLRGVEWKRTPDVWSREFHYGICQKLERHKYLLPFHTRKYGWGNLLKDGETHVLWHQWYGSYRKRPLGSDDLRGAVGDLEKAERAFFADYPNLDLSCLTPAWGPECDIEAERRAVLAARPGGLLALRGLAARLLARLGLRRGPWT